MLWRYRLPFLVMPVAVTLWYMSMDLTPFLFGTADASWELRKLVSLWFGLLMVLLAFWVDVRTQDDRDYAFWLYLFGVVAFWCGLSLMRSDSEFNKFIYLCINLAMIFVGAALSRRVFAVFGGLGAAGYVGHLAYEVFRDSMLFPFVLTVIGLAVVALGVVWQRREAAISRFGIKISVVEEQLGKSIDTDHRCTQLMCSGREKFALQLVDFSFSRYIAKVENLRHNVTHAVNTSYFND